MLNRRFVAPFASLALAGALVISLTGCSGKPENSPVVQKKFAELDEMKETLNDNALTLSTMTGELAIIKDDLASLRASDPNSQAGQELLSRLDQFEQRLKVVGDGSEAVIADLSRSQTSTPDAPTASHQGLATQRTLADATADPKLNTAKPSTSSVERLIPESQREMREQRPTTPKASTPVAPKASSAPKAAAPKPAAATRGRYYTLQNGDTLESVAQKNEIAVAVLRKENRLPSGASVYKGQRIYIPGKK